LDWHGSHLEGTLAVTRLNDYIEAYACHPEAKAADRSGNPAGPDTIGLLGRLRVRSGKLSRIGKEIDRLGGDEGAVIEATEPIDYERDTIGDDIAYLGSFPQKTVADDLGLTERGWRDLVKGRAEPHRRAAERIRTAAAHYRMCTSARP
jgi:hypothetical protein